ncbi:glycosyltransferase family 4 protein [Hoyosella rhizosphaerae]|uniref:Glycosyl transferase n=1 Tax=Hoyosella rhizosphaerae TaxID=1755582 RepID=A0A916TZI9_9ACTN|nr:glycosyltransferase family 4 protein [Hoyosella rhizosphaerae]MBN4927364.1 glycosyltransferase family 4 protein [Hoyosella rhizosphaerae]GGC51857.1 putative glycosyl transferase [Hoyosella rhizosphaerae]
MKILIISWEYPPVVVGGLGRHVHNLAIHLASAGHDVVVLSRQPSGTDSTTHPTTDTVTENVRVIAVAEDPPHLIFEEDMLAWTLAMGHAMVRHGLSLLGSWQPDVIHAHDWLVAHPAIALAQHSGAPLVATIHATEAGRHSGWISGKINRQVHSVEWWLANSADAVITCSQSMRDEVVSLFGPALAVTTVIHNGIDTGTWTFQQRSQRTGPATLLFAGRLEYEKGVHDAIAALADVRKTHPGTILLVAGTGTQRAWLEQEAIANKVDNAIVFLGSLNHDELLTYLHRADAILLPSRYEPFGIVALEAAASGTPLITSTAGGLGEAVIDGVTGRTFPPGDVTALTSAIRNMLDEPELTQKMATAARERLTTEFEWSAVTDTTLAVYAETTRRPPRELPRPTVTQRPLPGR